jgi:G protein-coupled receptor family C group 5 protein A
MKQSYGVENRAYSQEDITQGVDRTGDMFYAPYSTHFQLQNQAPRKDVSIPQAQASPYSDYKGQKEDS